MSSAVRQGASIDAALERATVRADRAKRTAAERFKAEEASYAKLLDDALERARRRASEPSTPIPSTPSLTAPSALRRRYGLSFRRRHAPPPQREGWPPPRAMGEVEGLTFRQQMVLDFIKATIGSKGYPPTMREIASFLGFGSTNGVNDHLRALKRKGYLTSESNKNRTLRPTMKAYELGRAKGGDVVERGEP